MTVDRIPFFEDFLKKKPDDAFARYALAMEYAKAERTEEAVGTYRQLLEQHSNYPAGYFQYALLLTRLGQKDPAMDQLRLGIRAATENGDQHARREMTEYLERLESNDDE